VGLAIRRRDFIALLSGSAIAWPLASRAQPNDRGRRIGWLDLFDENAEQSRAILQALREELARHGWIAGRNLNIDARFAAGDVNLIRRYAAELVSLAPDVLVTPSMATTRVIQQMTQIIPIVFTGGGDAVANGVVRNIARPEGNNTGFSSSEPAEAGKWLELLKRAAPQLSRIAVVFKPDVAPTAPKYIAAIEAAAQTLSVETVEIAFHDAVDLVHAIDAFALMPDRGLIVLPPPLIPDRVTILKLAMQHRLPAMYPQRALALEGGLLSYSSDLLDQNRRAAAYIDRLLRGAKIADLPVQFPTKFQLVVNMKTAKAMDLAIPEAFLLHADEILE
jgi:putative ABC transport system substrate-binding protein